MVTANVATKQDVQKFTDTEGISYDLTSIYSMSRNAGNPSVSVNVEGQLVTVEITPTEAINIIELLN